MNNNQVNPPENPLHFDQERGHRDFCSSCRQLLQLQEQPQNPQPPQPPHLGFECSPCMQCQRVTAAMRSLSLSSVRNMTKSLICSIRMRPKERILCLGSLCGTVLGNTCTDCRLGLAVQLPKPLFSAPAFGI